MINAGFDPNGAKGESARQALGIDGTAGDAQDVDHAFVDAGNGRWCLACGLSQNWKRHSGPDAGSEFSVHRCPLCGDTHAGRSNIKAGDRILATTFGGDKVPTVARSAPYMGHKIMVIDIDPIGGWTKWPAADVELDHGPYPPEIEGLATPDGRPHG